MIGGFRQWVPKVLDHIEKLLYFHINVEKIVWKLGNKVKVLEVKLLIQKKKGLF